MSGDKKHFMDKTQIKHKSGAVLGFTLTGFFSGMIYTGETDLLVNILGILLGTIIGSESLRKLSNPENKQ